jgi:rhamnosyltransferase
MTEANRNEAAGRTVAVMVTWNPDHTVGGHAATIAEQVDELVIVDNGTVEREGLIAPLAATATLITLGANRGLGAALNRGVAEAKARGAAWVVLFDQDSRPSANYVATLHRSLNRHEQGQSIAVIGGRLVEPTAGLPAHRWLRRHEWIPFLFQKVPSGGADLAQVTMVITSGSMVRVAAWEQVGGFDETLFVDAVDTEFCLRCRAFGWIIAVSSGAILHHRLGRRKRHVVLWVEAFPTHHPPLRHYYVARNRWLVARKHAVREAHWMIFELCVAGLWLFRTLAFECDKRTKLRAAVLGTWDGFLGRNGPASERRRRALDRGRGRSE